MVLGEAAREAEHFNVALNRERIKSSPNVDLAKPVSRQNEEEFLQYYGWPYYGGSGMWGLYDYPQMQLSTPIAQTRDPNADPHLRSMNEVTGYHVRGRDGEIGHIQDFIWDDRTWAIRYLVIDTSNWWTGRHVLVAPRWIDNVSWAEKKVTIDLPRELIKLSPEWKPKDAVSRDYEQRLHAYYSRPAYWVEEERRRHDSTRESKPEILAEHR